MNVPVFFNKFGLFLVLAVGVAWPRLILLGDFPHMDEGLSVFLGALCLDAFAGEGRLPLMHGLPMEPLSLAWVYVLPGFPVIWLRLCDLLFALAAGFLLCRIYQAESGSCLFGLLLALVVLCPMNYPGVIDAGYKNAIPPAFCFLFGACLITLNDPPANSTRWFCAGLCVCFSVLFREPFFVFAILGLVAAFASRGPRAALRYIAGGIAGLLPVLVFLVLIQGTGVFGELLEAYMARGALYAQETGRIAHNFHSGLYKSLHNFGGPILLLAAVGGLCVFCRKALKGLSLSRGLFWLAVFLLPLLEPLTKIGFLYHFSVCLPGLGGLAAWLAKGLGGAKMGKTIFACAACCALISITGLPGPAKAAMTIDMLKRFPANGWPEEWAAKSNPLLAAARVKEILPPGGTMAASAFSFFLYPAVGAMPPKNCLFEPGYGLSDLGRFYAKLDLNGDKLAGELKANPPDVLAIGEAFDVHEKDYAAELRRAVEKSGLYQLDGVVGPDPARHYGWLGFHIYRKKTG